MGSISKISMIKKYALKIIIPILIILAIGAIWLIKNADKESAAGDKPGSDSAAYALIVTEEIDLEELKSYGLPIMIDFGSDSCIPCKEMAPILEKLNKKLQGKAIIKFVDVWKYPELAQNYPISVIPTQMFFNKDGKPYTPSDPQALKINMYSLKDTNEHVFTTHEGGMTEETILAALKEMGLEE